MRVRRKGATAISLIATHNRVSCDEAGRVRRTRDRCQSLARIDPVRHARELFATKADTNRQLKHSENTMMIFASVNHILILRKFLQPESNPKRVLDNPQ